MLSITLEDLLVLVVVWFATSMVANLLWTRFVVLKYVGRAFMTWINGLKDDEEGQEALSNLMMMVLAWMGNARIKTGKKIKVQDGDEVKEIDEELAPIDLMGRVIGNYAIQKIKGQTGGTKTQIGRMLQEEAADNGMGLSPAALMALSKGKLGPALAEVGMPFLMKKLNKGQGDTSSGGEWK